MNNELDLQALWKELDEYSEELNKESDCLEEVWVKIAGTRGDQNPSGGNYFPCLFSEVVSSETVNVALMYNLASFGASPNSSQYGAALGQWKYIVSPESYTLDVGQWVQIVQTYSGSVLSLYRNGTLLNSSTISHTLRASSSRYNIAKRWDQSDAVYGDYSMVNMYSRALSLSEIHPDYFQIPKEDKEKIIEVAHAIDVSDEAVEAMIADSLEHAFEDRDARLFTEAKLQAEEMLPAVENALRELHSLLSSDMQNALRARVDDVRLALKQEELTSLKKGLQELDQATQGLATLLVEKAMHELD
jgi:hypothetical protein